MNIKFEDARLHLSVEKYDIFPIFCHRLESYQCRKVRLLGSAAPVRGPYFLTFYPVQICCKESQERSVLIAADPAQLAAHQFYVYASPIVPVR